MQAPQKKNRANRARLAGWVEEFKNNKTFGVESAQRCDFAAYSALRLYLVDLSLVEGFTTLLPLLQLLNLSQLLGEALQNGLL